MLPCRRSFNEWKLVQLRKYIRFACLPCSLVRIMFHRIVCGSRFLFRSTEIFYAREFDIARHTEFKPSNREGSFEPILSYCSNIKECFCNIIHWIASTFLPRINSDTNSSHCVPLSDLYNHIYTYVIQLAIAAPPGLAPKSCFRRPVALVMLADLPVGCSLSSVVLSTPQSDGCWTECVNP